MAEALLPFGKKGPGPLRRTEPTVRTTSDGKRVTTEWAYPYFVANSHVGVSRERVRDWLRWVFQHSRSWVRAGVWFPEVSVSPNALVVVRYVNEPMECGDTPTALGCTSRQMGPDGQTLIRMGNQRIGRPGDPQGFQKGIEHELGHAAFWASHGQGFRYAAGKLGILAPGSEPGIWPTDVDIASVVAYTRGRNLVMG